MTAPITAVAATASTGPPARPAASSTAPTFHEVLSALNPLQYLPVIGTIYRAVTGDTIPEPIREFGSLILSALMGGPIGVAINLATMAAEEVTGIDLDRTGQALLHGASIETALAGKSAAPIAHAAASADAAVLPAHAASPTPVKPWNEAPSPPTTTQPWSPAQLAAYGVTTSGQGTLRMGDRHGADVLNALELARIRAAYARVAALAP